MTFNFKRYLQVTRKDLTENKKKYLTFFGAAVAIFYCIQVLFFRIKDPITADSPLFGLISLCFLALTHVSMASTFDCLNSKQKRLTYMLTPASHLEKYLSRLTIALPLGLLGIILALIVSEMLCRFTVNVIFGYDLPSISLSMLHELTQMEAFMFTVSGSNPPSVFVVHPGISVFFFCLSIFNLGSALFRKYAYIKTLLFTGLGLPLLLTLFALILSDQIEMLSDFFDIHFLLFANLLIGTAGILTLFNFVYPYYLFKKTTLTGYKLFSS